MTNTEFAQNDRSFLEACEKVKTLPHFQKFEPSKRQASKWRRKIGIAWKIAAGRSNE